MIASQVENLKKRAVNRNTKFVLLVVTKSKPKDLTIVINSGSVSGGSSGGHSDHPLDPVETETLKVDDFYSWLKKSCNMESFKHVQQMEESDLSNASVISSKLGKVLQELSVQYYKEQALRVKKMKSEVSTVGQPYLYARHRFKVAYYSEISMRSFAQGSTPLTSNNNQKVVKYLTQSYSYLMVINPRDHGISESELKTVGDIINFRICQLKLTDRKTVDQGIKQFLKHIAWYKSLSGDHQRRGLLFKHYSLVYRQYRMFGEMLESLPTGYLKKEDSYHNPGYYFQAAASQAKFRKIAAQKVCSRYRAPIESLLQNNAQIIEDLKRDGESCYEGFYGQQIDMDPQLFLGQETNASSLLKELPNRQIFRDFAKEILTVRHSEDIISMLMKAYNNYKKHQAMKRLTYSISSAIAEEHYYSKQWERAKMFFDRIAKTYKKEQWYNLYTSVRRLSLTCAKEMGKPKDYLTCLIDLISTKLDTTESEKETFLTELLSFLDGSSESGVAPLDAPLIVDVDSRHAVLGMALQFEKPFVCVHEPIRLNLQFKCFSPKAIKFQKINVQFKKKAYNFTLTDGEDLTQVFSYPPSQTDPKILDLTLQPNGEATTYSFPMIIKEKQEFECEAVNLYLVGHSGQQICFQWKMNDNKYYSSLIANYDYRYEVGEDSLFVERPVIRVTEPKPKLEIKFEHRPPALINEFYAVKVLLNSNDDNVIRGILQINPILNVRILTSVNNKLVELSTEPSVMVDTIAANTTKEIILFLQCVVPGMIRLKVNFAYESTTYPSLSQSSDLDIYVQYPFDATFTYMGSRSTGKDGFRLVPSQSISFFQKIINNAVQNVAVHDPLKITANKQDNQFRFNEGFPAHQQILVSTTLSCNTPYPILIDRVRFVQAEQSDEGTPNIECCSDKIVDFEEKRKRDDTTSVPSSFVGKEYMEQRDAYTLCHVLKANISGRSIKTGSLIITCHRQNPLITTDVDPSCTSITYEVPLPSLNIYHRNLRATFDSPSEAVLGKPFEAKLTIFNESSTLQELQLQVADSESFFFSGTTQLNFTILPFSEKTMTYIMIPVLTGHITFPKFTLKAVREQAHVLTESERWSIFVHMT